MTQRYGIADKWFRLRVRPIKHRFESWWFVSCSTAEVARIRLSLRAGASISS